MTVTEAVPAPSNATLSLVDHYIAVWSEPDAARRRDAISGLWVAGGVEFVEAVQFRGHEELQARVSEAYAAFVESGRYLVSAADDIAEHGDIVTFTIQLLAKEHPNAGEVAWAAQVFLVVGADGKIIEDYHLTVKPLPA
jgi:hypothetical protein